MKRLFLLICVVSLAMNCDAQSSGHTVLKRQQERTNNDGPRQMLHPSQLAEFRNDSIFITIDEWLLPATVTVTNLSTGDEESNYTAVSDFAEYYATEPSTSYKITLTSNGNTYEGIFTTSN